MDCVFIVTRNQEPSILTAYSSAISAEEVTRLTSVLDRPLFPNRPGTSFVVVEDRDKKVFEKDLADKGLSATELSKEDVRFLTHLE